MFLLRLLPSAEGVVDREQRHLGELAGIFCQGLRGLRPVVILRADLLAFFGVEKFQIGLGDLSGAMLGRHFIDDADRRLRQNADRRSHHFELIFAQLTQRQKRFVLP
jgi:hypothetical protein